ncbi:MAG: SWIM zinc finger family protein [Negativicutes bacterium]|nr:SWIM zinc finger family protein [Negativicutes bacterium]
MAWYNDGYYSGPRKVSGGIKARSEQGEFARNWWAKRWIQAMEKLVYSARLQRGRRYARLGQVLSMEETPNGIVARVQGSRPNPYKVTIRLQPLSDKQWEKVLNVLSGQAIFAAQLLAGEMPTQIEQAFADAGVSLFPSQSGDLETRCSCPDWANPCKHIAATHYILGDRFDEDPFLLFRMRGRSQEQILEGLRQRRARQAGPEFEEVEPEVAEEKVIPLEQSLAGFWEPAASLENFAVNVRRPSIDLPILKRLGEPVFTTILPLNELLGEAYQAISRSAVDLAYMGGGEMLPPPEEE